MKIIKYLINKNDNIKIKYDIKIILSKIIYIIVLYLIYISISPKKRVGIINLFFSQNIGNMLVKFSLSKKLEELGFKPVVITQYLYRKKVNISFVERTVKLKIVEKEFSELNETDYDYLVVSSDQTWGYFNKHYFYDIAFLRFAEYWKTPKFIYAASIAKDTWFYTKEEDKMASRYLRNFTGISFREKGLVKMAEKHLKLNVKPIFVLDPTLLIDKKDYLNEIKNYKRDFNFNEKYIFVYQLDKNEILEKALNQSSAKFNYKIYKLNLDDDYYIENFLFYMNISQAVVTDSFHGTVFSIIFNKPFISFVNRYRGKGRFDSLIQTFNLEKRIIDPLTIVNPNINLLKEPLNINRTLLSRLKNLSINYLKKNLGMIK